MSIPSESAASVSAVLLTQPATDSSIKAPSLWRLALVGIQLALILLVIWRYQLESRTFFNVMALGCVGFMVHAFLPAQYRLGFFAALSLGGIVLAFGPADGGWLILLGLGLIGICHLPVRMVLRVGLLLLTGGLFGLFRAELMHGPWS